MSMQDKDIDALFGNKLKHLEVEPSAKVWKGISLELDGVKHKSKILPVLRIAVSVMIFLSIGLFFLLQVDKTPVYTVNNIGQKPQPVKEIIDGNGNKAFIEQTQAPVLQKQAVVKIPKNNAITHSLKTGLTTKMGNLVNIAQTKPEIIVADQPVLAAAENTTLAHPTVPDIQLVTQHDLTTNDKFRSTENTETPDLPVKQKAKKHSIRTFGDLINVVIAKVDKRDDKVIEFSNTDDDGSVVSGINLGIVKIKKDK